MTFSSCSSKTLSPAKFQSRSYHFCTKQEVDNYQGSLCHRYCTSRRLISKKCRKTKLIIEDLKDINIHNKFGDAEFLIMRAKER